MLGFNLKKEFYKYLRNIDTEMNFTFICEIMDKKHNTKGYLDCKNVSNTEMANRFKKTVDEYEKIEKLVIFPTMNKIKATLIRSCGEKLIKKFYGGKKEFNKIILQLILQEVKWDDNVQILTTRILAKITENV